MLSNLLWLDCCLGVTLKNCALPVSSTSRDSSFYVVYFGWACAALYDNYILGHPEQLHFLYEGLSMLVIIHKDLRISWFISLRPVKDLLKKWKEESNVVELSSFLCLSSHICLLNDCNFEQYFHLFCLDLMLSLFMSIFWLGTLNTCIMYITYPHPILQALYGMSPIVLKGDYIHIRVQNWVLNNFLKCAWSSTHQIEGNYLTACHVLTWTELVGQKSVVLIFLDLHFINFPEF